MAESFVMTHDGIKELEEKLDFLKTVKRAECAEQIKIARGFGDLSENAEYDEAKNEQARVEGEIAKLEHMLKHAVVMDSSAVSSKTVSVGSLVTVLDVELDEETEYAIVGSAEAKIADNKISNESPVGKALIGRKTGDSVEVDTPSGMIQMKIIKIAKQGQ